MDITRAFYLADTETEDYVPFTHEVPDGGMATFGEMHWIRQQGSGEHTLLVALWRLREPGRSPIYTFGAGDESFVVLEGEVTIELLDTGEKVDLKPGDIASFSKGTRSIWNFHSPFKKFLVIAHSEPLPEPAAPDQG